MTAIMLNSFAVPLTDAQNVELNTMSSEFRFLLSEVDVPEKIQVRLTELGYRSMRTYVAMADDRAALRVAIAADVLDAAELGLTQAQIALVRVITASLLAAWTTASTRDAEPIRAAADNKVMRLPALVSRSGLVGFRQRFERENGRIQDCVFPCASLIERRLEEVEERIFCAQPLSEIISVEAAGDEVTDFQDLGVNIRVRKTPKAINLPGTTEEFRQRMKTLAVSYVIAGYKHSSRLWLRTATMQCFTNYVEHILSAEVAAFHLDSEGISVKASWPTVLNYELNMRKLVVRKVLYEDLDFQTALNAAMIDLQCRERYFITPTALLTAAKGGRGSTTTTLAREVQIGKPGLPGQGQSPQAKKRAKAAEAKKGKGKGVMKTIVKEEKGKGKGKTNLMSKTPDGRWICGFVNTAAGCVKPKCNFLHCCNLCYATDHVAANCPN